LAESLKRRIADLEEAVAKKDAMCAEYKCTLENLLSKRDMELEELQDLRDARRHSSNVAPKSELDAAMDEIKLLKSDLERYRVQMKDLLPSSALEQAHQQLATCRQENEKMKMRLQDWPSRDEFEKLQTEFQMRAAELSRQRRKCAEMHCDRDELLALSSSNTKLVAESIRLKDAMAGMVKRSEVDAAQKQCAMLKATAGSTCTQKTNFRFRTGPL
jgi:chromosome segregation ATPase